MTTNKNYNEFMDFDEMMNAYEKRISVLDEHLGDAKCLLFSMKKFLKKEKSDVDKMVEMARQYEVIDSDIIKLNVGGSHFSTVKSTLTKKIQSCFNENEYYEPHLLQLLVSGIVKVTLDENKEIFIDRNPQYFGYILDYLRNVGTNKPYKLPKLNADALNEFYEEAEFYNLNGLVDNSVSTILPRQEFAKLNTLSNFSVNQQWKLIYRGSVDGFDASQFHSKCNGISNTLTVVKSEGNYVFGGYTNAAWDSNGGYKNDPNAFIFSLVNKTNTPLKLNCVNAAHAICCPALNCTTFGPNSLHISSNANISATSTSVFNSAYYQLPPGYTNGEEANSFLAGSSKFQVKEVEVFTK